MCASRDPAAVPVIVAAVGNDSTKRAGYPAIVPGAIVAMSLEEVPAGTGTFVPAQYNSAPPPAAVTRQAFGGSAGDPLGTVMRGAASTPLYGSSFAAAAVTAAYLP
jgi:hypothetical protein